MSYTKTNWTDGTTPVDASNLNKIEDALADQDSRIDANTDLIGSLFSDYVPIYNMGNLPNETSILDFVSDFAQDLYSSNNSNLHIGMIHCRGVSMTLDLPSSAFGYANGIVLVGADVCHLILFSYLTRGQIAVNTRTRSSDFGDWYVFKGEN